MSLPTFPATLGSLGSPALDSVVLWQPGSGYRCVLGAAVPPLKQLRLNSCRLALQDGGKGLAAALALLPGLEHLSMTNSAKVAGCHLQLSGIKLRKLQQLTYLHLQQRTELQRQGPDSDPIKLHHLAALTRLSDLRLSLSRGYNISASMLSASQHLTHLQLEMNAVRFKQSALAGRTQLQHMDLQGQRVSGDAAGAAQWLSEPAAPATAVVLGVQCVFNNFPSSRSLLSPDGQHQAAAYETWLLLAGGHVAAHVPCRQAAATPTGTQH